MTKTLNCTDYDEDDPKRKSSRPSAEEGHRFGSALLSVERADLREEIFNFVEQILRRQDRGQSVQRREPLRSRKSGCADRGRTRRNHQRYGPHQKRFCFLSC